LLFAGIKPLSRLDFEADPRWYERFPRILRKDNISFIGDDLRTKPEDAQEILAQKKKLTQANLLPLFNFPKLEVKKSLRAITKEAASRELTVTDFWKYIYEI
jgi:hypothetical protein